MKRSPYPLQWPANAPRTKSGDRQRSTFGGKNKGEVSPYEAAKELLEEVRRLGGSHAVVTSLLPTRHDGLPYADGRRGDDPGIALWFVHRGHERVFACDKWRTHGENMRAIALSIEAMRGLDRWGVAGAVEKAFAGFAALPAGNGDEDVPPAPKKRPWREVLGETFAPWPELDNDELLVLAKGRHRKLIALHHPDKGGDVAIAAEINAALAEAEQELG